MCICASAAISNKNVQALFLSFNLNILQINNFKMFNMSTFDTERINTPPNIETAPAGIFLPLAVLLALRGLINTDSSSSVGYKR